MLLRESKASDTATGGIRYNLIHRPESMHVSYFELFNKSIPVLPQKYKLFKNRNVRFSKKGDGVVSALYENLT